ncbi:hypothetical protein GOP47_0028799 [Adiantum capillus-veneris]|nr:hypothetical protein GOP47_0028799 [Adiantum capillus-veneris]
MANDRVGDPGSAEGSQGQGASPVLQAWACGSDLKSRENLSRWRQVWEEKAGAPDVVVKWGEALRALNAFNGEIFTQDTSEALYINRVVHNVCKVLPSPLPEDLSPIKGLYRLAKEVSGQFDNSRQCEEACLMGLHGVGGLGKTTMCKIMVNFYSAEYPGRCHHLQFPTDGKDMPQIVHVCKKVLKELTKLSHELLLNKADNFDQVR